MPTQQPSHPEIPEAVATSMAEACHVDDEARRELMLLFTRLVLAEHPHRIARDAAPQAAHKLDSLGRALVHLQAFMDETHDWNRGGRVPQRYDADDPDALVHAWRLVELRFSLPETHQTINLGDGRTVDVGETSRALVTWIRDSPMGGLSRLAHALVQAVSAARDDLESRLAAHPSAAAKSKPRTDGLRETMCELCHVFDAVHRVDHEGDRVSAKIEFVAAALSVVGEERAPGTIRNRLNGPELGAYWIESLVTNLRAQGSDAATIDAAVRQQSRSALETPPPLLLDAEVLLDLLRNPVMGSSAQARGAWCEAVIATGISDRLGGSLAVRLGQPEVQ